MRRYEERLAALNLRAAEIRKQRRRRGLFAAQLASVCVCLALTVLLAAFMPGLCAPLVSGLPVGMGASLFSGSAVPGFIVTGVIAFLLGVSVTLFCLYLKKLRDAEENDEDKP